MYNTYEQIQEHFHEVEPFRGEGEGDWKPLFHERRNRERMMRKVGDRYEFSRYRETMVIWHGPNEVEFDCSCQDKITDNFVNLCAPKGVRIEIMPIVAVGFSHLTRKRTSRYRAWSWDYDKSESQYKWVEREVEDMGFKKPADKASVRLRKNSAGEWDLVNATQWVKPSLNRKQTVKLRKKYNYADFMAFFKALQSCSDVEVMGPRYRYRYQPSHHDFTCTSEYEMLELLANGDQKEWLDSINQSARELLTYPVDRVANMVRQMIYDHEVAEVKNTRTDILYGWSELAAFRSAERRHG